ncbi:hypothetical protein TNCV_2233611 [Trichonephila clavipes]|nr:hypothetical protein TNCV_2233611 [Trichonephila clavipes]
MLGSASQQRVCGNIDGHNNKHDIVAASYLFCQDGPVLLVAVLVATNRLGCDVHRNPLTQGVAQTLTIKQAEFARSSP